MALLVTFVPVSSAVAQEVLPEEARVVNENRINERTLDLKISSPALGADGSVRLLLPDGWSRDSGRTWPVVYLLHGCCDDADYKAWTEYTDIEKFLADKDVITVMPSDGAAGFYTKWWNFGLGGPDWETFHTQEVRHILEDGYGAGTDRVVGGISIGGYGAMTYSYRFPGMFKAAASYSGLVHTMGIGVPQLISGILVREGENPLAMWGSSRTNEELWTENNPYAHAEALRGTPLYVSSGNGHAGPFDPPDHGYDALEGATLPVSKAFVGKLEELGVSVQKSFYGNGTHSWPYWEREFKRSWPMMASALDD